MNTIVHFLPTVQAKLAGRGMMLKKKKAMEEVSKLVEVVRPCRVHILIDLDFSAFRDRRNTEYDNRNISTESGFLAYSFGGCEKLFELEAKTHQD